MTRCNMAGFQLTPAPCAPGITFYALSFLHGAFGPRPFVAGILLTLTPASLQAQLVTNPVKAEFTPAADHDSVASDGTPIVTRYDLQFYLPGAAAPFQTGSLASRRGPRTAPSR